VSLRSRVVEELGTVYDPELDEPITTLGFVGSVVVDREDGVEVRLRLPTPQCAPNFAYLMAADARAAILRIAGVGAVTVVLEDHYTGDEINAAVGSEAGFEGAFPGETAGDLTPLRELFQRKALVARQARVCEALRAAGLDDAAVVALRLADLPASAEATRCRELRAELGLPCGPDAPGLIAGDGSALTPDALPMWLRRASLVRTSLEANGGICRSLLRVRHGIPEPEEVPA
jgi:metal-sulfur cluster biosynthetic enzyme